jgi:hypothetical protein
MYLSIRVEGLRGIVIYPSGLSLNRRGSCILQRGPSTAFWYKEKVRPWSLQIPVTGEGDGLNFLQVVAEL